MVSAQELRIGNWINIDGEGLIDSHYAKVNLFLLGKMEESKTERFTGIPLTPEIFEKAGFTQSKVGSLWKIKEIHGFTMERRAGRYYLKEYKIDRNGLKYLHQLQNLFYAVVGEELKIEL